MKSQVVNILSFADPVISVAALQLCWCSVRATPHVNKWERLCSNKMYMLPTKLKFEFYIIFMFPEIFFLFFKLFKTVKMVASPSGTVGQIWLWLSHTRIGGSCEHQYTCWRRKNTNKGTTKRQKPNYNKRAHTNRRKDKPRVSRQGDQRNHTTESHRIPTIEVHLTKDSWQSRDCDSQKHKESPKMGR